MVWPALASQDIAATLPSQTDDCHAVIGVLIPKEETVFATASLKKAKAEMPKTSLELVLLQQVLDTIGKHMDSNRISNGSLEFITECLSDHYERFEASWKKAMRSRIGDVYFQESAELCHTALRVVDKAYEDIANSGAKIKAITDAEAKAQDESTLF